MDWNGGWNGVGDGRGRLMLTALRTATAWERLLEVKPTVGATLPGGRHAQRSWIGSKGQEVDRHNLPVLKY